MKKTLIAVLLSVLSLSAFGQDLAPIIVSFPGLPATFAGSGTSNNLASLAPITLKRGNGLAIWLDIRSTNGTTAASPVGFKFNLSADGVTYSTTLPLTNSVTLSGTNNAVAYTLFTPDVLNHARYIRLDTIVNVNTNIININSVKASYFGIFQ